MRAGRLDGFIPHTAFWDRPAYWRRAPFYGTHTVFGATATATIQTPLLALAWELVAQASRRRSRVRHRGAAQLRLHYDWLARERDVDGDGLLTTITPDESGLDDSPKYDELFGWMRHDRPRAPWLIERYRRLSYDAAQIASATRSTSRTSPSTSSTRSRCRRSRGSTPSMVTVYAAPCAADRVGAAGALLRRAHRACSTTSPAPPSARCACRRGPRSRRWRCASMPAGHPPTDRRGALAASRAATGRPTESRRSRSQEPSFHPSFEAWRCWRGPSWMNTAWLLVPAMRELGYGDGGASGSSPRSCAPSTPRLSRVLQPAHRPRAGGPRLRLLDADRRSSRTLPGIRSPRRDRRPARRASWTS